MSICRQLELFFLKLHGLKTPNLIQVEQRIVRLLFLDLFEQQLMYVSRTWVTTQLTDMGNTSSSHSPSGVLAHPLR
jgi:hypothetical protein